MKFASKTNDLVAFMSRINHIKVFSAENDYAKSDNVFSRESKDFLTGNMLHTFAFRNAPSYLINGPSYPSTTM